MSKHYMRKAPMTEAERRRYFDRVTADRVPITRLGIAPMGHVMLPVAVLDASARPDVADLARIHATEGTGDVRTSWDFLIPSGRGERRHGVLRFKLARPVKARFCLVVDLDRDRPWLDLVARTGLLATTGREHADVAALVTDSVAWQVSTEPRAEALALADLLDATEPRRSARAN